MPGSGIAGISESGVIDCVGNLVDKSLVTADVGIEVRYRLLETTRAYALGKLIESGEHGDVARRHAEYYRTLFQRAAAETKTRPAAEWLAVYGSTSITSRAALTGPFAGRRRHDRRRTDGRFRSGYGSACH
jgi:predicted ATPase